MSRRNAVITKDFIRIINIVHRSVYLPVSSFKLPLKSPTNPWRSRNLGLSLFLRLIKKETNGSPCKLGSSPLSACFATEFWLSAACCRRSNLSGSSKSIILSTAFGCLPIFSQFCTGSLLSVGGGFWACAGCKGFWDLGLRGISPSWGGIFPEFCLPATPNFCWRYWTSSERWAFGGSLFWSQELEGAAFCGTFEGPTSEAAWQEKNKIQGNICLWDLIIEPSHKMSEPQKRGKRD